MGACPLAAQVSFDHTRGVSLGISRQYVNPFVHPIEDSFVRGRLWHFLASTELLEGAGRIVKEVMDLVFLSGGIETGFWMVNEEGDWVDVP
jgi:hypothetical protein